MLDLSPATLHNKIKTFNLDDRNQPIYQESFYYQPGTTLKYYIPKIFKAALEYSGNHPYAAIKQLNVSQGYFYKIIKTG